MNNRLISNPTPLPQQGIHQAIKNQVITEHRSEFKQAVGWQKRWIKWKISFITEIRYRGIFFLGIATK